jgi:hypothetical protein
MAHPDTAFRAVDSLAILPDDPAAAAEEIQRRREEIGFSYFVFGADVAGAFAPVIAELAGRWSGWRGMTRGGPAGFESRRKGGVPRQPGESVATVPVVR